MSTPDNLLPANRAHGTGAEPVAWSPPRKLGPLTVPAVLMAAAIAAGLVILAVVYFVLTPFYVWRRRR